VKKLDTRISNHQKGGEFLELTEFDIEILLRAHWVEHD